MLTNLTGSLKQLNANIYNPNLILPVYMCFNLTMFAQASIILNLELTLILKSSSLGSKLKTIQDLQCSNSCFIMSWILDSDFQPAILKLDNV